MKNIKLTICSLCSLITLILNHAAIAKTRVWNLTPTNLVVYRKEIIFNWHSSPLLRDHDYIQWRTNVNGKTTYLQEWQKEYENDSFHIPTSTISSVNKYGEAHTLRINGTFDGKMYKPDFSVESDGLYVKYVPVPEIPQITAIIGALALTFAAIRKRKGNN